MNMENLELFAEELSDELTFAVVQPNATAASIFSTSSFSSAGSCSACALTGSTFSSAG